MFQIQTSLTIRHKSIRSFQEDHDLNVDGTITNIIGLTDALRTKIDENDTQYQKPSKRLNRILKTAISQRCFASFITFIFC